MIFPKHRKNMLSNPELILSETENLVLKIICWCFWLWKLTVSGKNCTVFSDVLSMHLPKRLFTDSVKRSGKMLFGIFFLLLTGNFLKNYITVNMNSGPAMVLPVIFSLTLKIRIPILNQMVNLPEDLTRSISMLCFLYLISVLLIF